MTGIVAGAGLIIGGNVGVDSPEASITGTGLYPLTRDASKQFCKFPTRHTLSSRD